MPSLNATTYHVPSGFVLWTMRLLCVTALGISGYLAVTSFRAVEVVGCSGSAVLDCNHTLKSQYAKVFGVPVSVPAFVLYASMLSVLFFFRKSAPTAIVKAGWTVLGIGSLCAAGAAFWFIGLQVAEGKFCHYCLGAHSCGLVLAMIVVFQSPLSWKKQAGFLGLAMTAVLALVASQTLVEPPPKFTDEPAPSIAEIEGGSGEPGEFSAPGEFAAPIEFAPPVFDAPGMDVADSSDAEESPTDTETTQTALVPPPVDVPQNVEVARKDDDQAEHHLTKADGGQLNPVPEPELSMKDEETAEESFAYSDLSDSVEFTPPMEVPVVLPDSASGIQPVDFREVEAQDEEAAPAADESQDTTAAPSTSDAAPVSPKPEQTVSQTDGEVQEQTIETAADLKPSTQAIGYLFFSASGATNANLADLLLMADADMDGEVKKDVEAKKEVAKPRMVVVRNQFSLNPKHWPLLGDAEAKYVFVEMFDYTCSHCRATNKAVKGAMKELGDDLAIIALPVPLERKCNSTVTGMGAVGACDMAKYGVAVWRLDQSKFKEYHNYMCDQLRTANQAKVKAEALVGKDKLQAELKKAYISEYIKRHVDLYRKVGSGAVPKLMFPKSTLTGEINSSKLLVQRIKSELGP